MDKWVSCSEILDHIYKTVFPKISILFSILSSRLSRNTRKLRHKLRHSLNWHHWSPNFQQQKNLSNVTDNLSHLFTNLRQHYQNCFIELLLLTIISSRMSRNMRKIWQKLQNIKKCSGITLSCYFRNSNGQIHKYKKAPNSLHSWGSSWPGAL